jgi:hypothetical protein
LTLGMHTADRAEALVWFEKLRDVGVERLVVKGAGPVSLAPRLIRQAMETGACSTGT